LLPATAVHGARLLPSASLTLILPRVCLAVGCRVSASGAAVLVGRCLVRIRRATTVLGIVLPIVAAPSAISVPIAAVVDVLFV
jgi:hypothetical protein